MGYIELKDVQEEDAPYIFQWENDKENWEVSETSKPYTRDEILALIASAEDYNESRQKRWMVIEKESKKALGTVDIFQGELQPNETGIGILIARQENRRKGYAEQAIRAVIDVATNSYHVDTFYATIHVNNLASLKLFKKCGFRQVKTEPDNSTFGKESKAKVILSLCVKN